MRALRVSGAIVAIAGLCLPGATAQSAEFDRTDYSEMDVWLCHPDKADDACTIDLTTTAINADGSTEILPFEAATDPAFDCFYIYPTVSFDVTPNSDLEPGIEELNVIANQFARYGSTCRLFAPVYRQATLVSIRERVTTGASSENTEMRYADVIDSWNHYLENHNDGRGIALIGHSQGASMIFEMLQKDLIASDAADQLISIQAIGSPAHVDENETFEGVPMCTSTNQTGCIINYMSFKAVQEPPVTSFFGRINANNDRAMCVNPAALSGDGALHAYMPRQSLGQFRDNDYGVKVDTPFVTLPGFASGTCRTNATHDWLAIDTVSDTADIRAGKLGGEVIVEGAELADWGLHLIDMNVAIGNLIEITEQQAETWLATQEGDAG